MIYAVIVTYEPDLGSMASLLQRLVPQVEGVVVVDNCSSVEVVNELRGLVSDANGVLLDNDANLGVAEAFGQGIEVASRHDADYVLLLDQDSLPAEDMVSCLLTAIELKCKQGVRVAAVGPAYADVKGEFKPPFVRLNGISLERVEHRGRSVVEVDHLISSGSLVCLSAVRNIGLMDNDLFIDYVDTEWCLRAKYFGYHLYGVADAKMDHDLGDDVVSFLGRKLPVHSSLRYYYLIRNGVWVVRQSWVGWRWRLMDVRRLIMIYIVYSLFVGDRRENWKMMSKGAFHGLSGRMGKYRD